MMTALREKMIKSKFYRVVLWIILFSMCGGSILFSPFLFRQAGTSQPTLLTVNGQDITVRQYEQRLAQVYETIGMIRGRYGEYADTFLKILGMDNPQELAIRNLVNDTLINQAAEKLNLNLSSQFIMQKLYDPSFVVNELRDIVPVQVLDQTGAINMQALTYWLQKSGQTMADFEQRLEKALQRKVVTDLIGTSLFISPEELKQYFSATNLKKKYDIAVLPFQKYLNEEKKQPIAKDELEKFFKKENDLHKTYWIPEKRSGTLVKFTPEAFGIQISEKDIENYYSKHKQEKFLANPVQIHIRRILFKVEEGTAPMIIKEKALKVYDELKEKPELFEKLAEEHSDDSETAQKGGDLGFVKRGDRDAAFWRAALRLQKNKEISDVVATESGFEILQRVDRKAPEYKPLESVKDEIKGILLKQKFKRQFTEDADKVIAQAKDSAQVLDDFIAQKKGKKENIANQISDESPLKQKLFKGKKGQWNTFVDKEGTGVLLKVEEIQKSYEPVLQDVQKQVEEDFYRQKAQKQLKDTLIEVENAAKSENIKAIVDRLGLEHVSTDWLKKDDTEKLESLEKKGIPTNQLLFKSERVGSVTSGVGMKDGYVAKLEMVEPFDWVLYKDKKQELEKGLFQEKKDLLTRAFVDSLNKNATIKRIEQQNNARSIPLEDIV